MLAHDGKLHFSHLKHIEESPLHYAHAVKGREDTAAMLKGRVVHAWTLQEIKPAVWDGERRGNAWKEFAAEHKGEDIITASEWDDVRRMAAAVHGDAFAREVLTACKERETAIEWERCGVPCSGRIDFHATDCSILGDLKTTACAAPRKFLWDAAKMHYDAQLPWYAEGQGLKVCGPDTIWPDAYIIAVESKAPFPVIVYKLDQLRMDQGYEKTVRWMNAYLECVKSNAFSVPYTHGVQTWEGDINLLQSEEEE